MIVYFFREYSIHFRPFVLTGKKQFRQTTFYHLAELPEIISEGGYIILSAMVFIPWSDTFLSGGFKRQQPDGYCALGILDNGLYLIGSCR